MNKLLIASATMLSLVTGSAMAADLTDKLAWNSELTTAYNITDEVFTSEFETGLSYAVTADVSVYGTLFVDVKGTEFTGSEFGVVYTPAQIKQLTASAYVTLDKDFKNEQAFLEVALKF